MTTSLKAPMLASPPSTRAVVLQLARFEVRTALRHQLTWVGSLGSLWLMWILGGDVAPILQRDSVYLAGAMLPLAGATLLVTNYSTLRQRRLPDILDSYPSGPSLRILGVQLGVTGPVLLTLLIQTVGLSYLLTGGPIGGIAWWELAVGPVMVALFGVGGVFLGRRLPHPIVAPVVLVGFAFLQLLASPDAQIFSSELGPVANVEWLAPWMMPSAFEPIEDLAARPSELHLGYLAALALVVVTLALPVKGWARLARLAVAGVFVAVLVGISLNLSSEPKSGFDWSEAAAAQPCSVQDGVEYCAFEFYVDWIPRWQETVAAVDAIAPVTITKVMQRPPNIGFDEEGTLETPGLVLANTHWDRVGATPYHRFDLALLAAHSAVGLPTTRQTRLFTKEEIESIVEQNPEAPGDLRAHLESQPPFPQSCSAIGQARAVVAVWLAATALDHGPEAIQSALERLPTANLFRPGYQHFHLPPTSVGRSDAELALGLLARPMADVQAELVSRWQEVVDPATTSADLASWFGLQAPIYPATEFVELPCL